jgi:hypothetical protein
MSPLFGDDGPSYADQLELSRRLNSRRYRKIKQNRLWKASSSSGCRLNRPRA